MSDALRKALHRAFSLGQTYWQQADSESYKQNAKSAETLQKFNELVEATADAIAAQAPSEDARDAARYRWLRDKADGGEWEHIGHGTTPETTDAAVDAAVAAQGTADGGA